MWRFQTTNHCKRQHQQRTGWWHQVRNDIKMRVRNNGHRYEREIRGYRRIKDCQRWFTRTETSTGNSIQILLTENCSAQDLQSLTDHQLLW
jgi:hypothetical protein